MPNWCSNSLTVIGDVEVLRELEAGAREGKFLETIKPIGEWKYNSALSAWGTKWDIDCESPDVDEENRTLYMNFDSAWSPPVLAYEHLMEWPGIDSVSATYFEPGMDYAGQWEDGVENHIEGICDLCSGPKANWPAGFADLNEEYDFEMWYDVEPDDLVEFIEDGLKAKQVSHDV